MNDYIEANRRHWNEVVGIHAASAFYDVASFKAGRSRLKPVELREVGDVRGKTLLHLQCHFGLDTLSWAREGAIVTGVDFALEAIRTGRELVAELGISARFIESNIYNLRNALVEEFDIVFTSYGALCWLPDLTGWARTAASYVKPNGTFYIVDGHPLFNTLYDSAGPEDVRIRHSYFRTGEPAPSEVDGTYADWNVHVQNRLTYEFEHPLGEIVSSIVDAGLQIEFLHEFPFESYEALRGLKKGEDGYYHLPPEAPQIPLLFSLKARKVGS